MLQIIHLSAEFCQYQLIRRGLWHLMIIFLVNILERKSRNIWIDVHKYFALLVHSLIRCAIWLKIAEIQLLFLYFYGRKCDLITLYTGQIIYGTYRLLLSVTTANFADTDIQPITPLSADTDITSILSAHHYRILWRNFFRAVF